MANRLLFDPCYEKCDRDRTLDWIVIVTPRKLLGYAVTINLNIQ